VDAITEIGKPFALESVPIRHSPEHEDGVSSPHVLPQLGPSQPSIKDTMGESALVLTQGRFTSGVDLSKVGRVVKVTDFTDSYKSDPARNIYVVGRRLTNIRDDWSKFEPKASRVVLPPALPDEYGDIGAELALGSIVGPLPKANGRSHQPAGHENQQHREAAHNESLVVIHENSGGGRKPENRTSEWFAYGVMGLLFAPILGLLLRRGIVIVWCCAALCLLVIEAI
jgi:hypothetical protein